MAVRCNLSTLMGQKRLNIQDINDKTGLARNTISALYHDKAKRIDYETINKLCEALECSSSELIEYIPDIKAEAISI